MDNNPGLVNRNFAEAVEDKINPKCWGVCRINFGEVRNLTTLGVRGVTPSKAHHFWPICKQNYAGNFCHSSWFCLFFPSFSLIFLRLAFFWGCTAPPTCLPKWSEMQTKEVLLHLENAAHKSVDANWLLCKRLKINA